MKFLSTRIEKENFTKKIVSKFTSFNELLVKSIVNAVYNILSIELISERGRGTPDESTQMCDHLDQVLSTLRDRGDINALKMKHTPIDQGLYRYVEDLISKQEDQFEHYLRHLGFDSFLDVTTLKTQALEIAKITDCVIALKIEQLGHYKENLDYYKTSSKTKNSQKKEKRTAEERMSTSRAREANEKWKQSLLGNTLAAAGTPVPLAEKDIPTNS